MAVRVAAMKIMSMGVLRRLHAWLYAWLYVWLYVWLPGPCAYFANSKFEKEKLQFSKFRKTWKNSFPRM